MAMARGIWLVAVGWACCGSWLYAADGAAEIDRRLAEEVFAKHAGGAALAPRTGDDIFLRRLYLDLVGQPPTPAEVREFVRDSAADKRAAKIAALLQDA